MDYIHNLIRILKQTRKPEVIAITIMRLVDYLMQQLNEEEQKLLIEKLYEYISDLKDAIEHH